MPNTAAITKNYYHWAERLFRVLDDIDDVAQARFAPREVNDFGRDRDDSLRHASGALAGRLRTILAEGRAEQYTHADFSQAFFELVTDFEYLYHLPPDRLDRQVRRRYEDAMRRARQRIFQHQLY